MSGPGALDLELFLTQRSGKPGFIYLSLKWSVVEFFLLCCLEDKSATIGRLHQSVAWNLARDKS